MFKTSHWYHTFPLHVDTMFGFVYYVQNKLTAKKYIGKKQYYTYKRGKKHKESDWKKYLSSSKHLNDDIQQFGLDNFYFEILFECKTRGDLTYAEANLQHKNNVLTERNSAGQRRWYNASIAAIKFVPAYGETKKKPSRRKKMMDAEVPPVPIIESIEWSYEQTQHDVVSIKNMWMHDPKFITTPFETIDKVTI
jgi:hypothetical protein